jgi:hypothetical protein
MPAATRATARADGGRVDAAGGTVAKGLGAPLPRNLPACAGTRQRESWVDRDSSDTVLTRRGSRLYVHIAVEAMTTDLIAGTPAVTVRRAGARLEELVRSEGAWITVCLVAGALDAFIGRHAMNPDGISYIDMARTTLLVGLRGLVNGYWSPGYPALIAASLRIASPSAATEFPTVRALNFLIFAVTVWLWRAVLRSWTGESPRGAAGDSNSLRSSLVPIGFGIFLLLMLVAVPPSMVTPDLGVLAVTLLIVLSYQRLQVSESWAAAVALGACCGLGFWMKTVMFPLGAALLAVLFLVPASVTRARSRVAVAALVWLAISAPLIALVSAKVGHLSYGETGRLNYGWFVSSKEYHPLKILFDRTWPHTPRELLSAPRIIEFGSPVAGTFPLHADPSYWWQGTPTRFDVGAQVRALTVNGFEYARQALFDYSVVVAVLIGLAAVSRPTRRSDGPTRSVDVLLVWSILWLALYAVVHVESRLAAPAVLLLAVLRARNLLPGSSPQAASAVSAVLAAFVLVQTLSLGWTTIRQARDHVSPKYLAIAEQLGALALTPNTRIAVIGSHDGYESSFAHTAGLVVAAEVVDVEGSPQITNDNVAAVKAALAQAGIRAIVKTRGPLPAAESGWRQIRLDDGSVAGVLFTAP